MKSIVERIEGLCATEPDFEEELKKKNWIIICKTG